AGLCAEEDAIRAKAWDLCGIVRAGPELEAAAEWFERSATPSDPCSGARRNLKQVALLMAECSLAREESRGAHYRVDYMEALSYQLSAISRTSARLSTCGPGARRQCQKRSAGGRAAGEFRAALCHRRQDRRRYQGNSLSR